LVGMSWVLEHGSQQWYIRHFLIACLLCILQISTPYAIYRFHASEQPYCYLSCNCIGIEIYALPVVFSVMTSLNISLKCYQ